MPRRAPKVWSSRRFPKNDLDEDDFSVKDVADWPPTTMPLKSLLQPFLEWFEGLAGGARHVASVFWHPLHPEDLAKAIEALELAQSSGGMAWLFTNGIPARTVVANLVFHCAGLGADRAGWRELNDDE